METPFTTWLAALERERRPLWEANREARDEANRELHVVAYLAAMPDLGSLREWHEANLSGAATLPDVEVPEADYAWCVVVRPPEGYEARLAPGEMVRCPPDEAACFCDAGLFRPAGWNEQARDTASDEHKAVENGVRKIRTALLSLPRPEARGVSPGSGLHGPRL